MLAVWNFLLKKSQFTWFLMSALIVAGIYAAYTIPKESSPEVIVPIGIVATTYPGAASEDVEQLVTNKVEDAAGSLANLDTITSNSSDGISVVTVQFTASADVSQSINDLKDAIDRIKPDLPSEADQPVVTKINFADQPVIVVSISTDLPPTEFTALSEKVKDELTSITGVQKVDTAGVRAREVQVVADPKALDAYSLSLQDIVSGIKASDVTLPAGSVTTGEVTYPIQFKGSIRDPDIVGDLPISSSDGRVVYLRDVATVSNGVEPVKTYSRVSVNQAPSEPAMTLFVYKNAGSNVTTVTNAIRDKLDALQKPDQLLNGSQVFISLDLGTQVYKDLSDLVRAGMETVGLIILSLLLTIGWRESFVAALSVPLSFVTAFIGLDLSGNTINFVSLFALILAVGILVDSGIVVTEAIHTRIRLYGDPIEAARVALREYAWPLIGGTLTTTAVFIPLFFISGIVGEFIKSIPFTLIFVLLASIFVALGMVPLIAIRLTKSTSTNRLEEAQERYNHKAQEWYRKHLLMLFESKRAQRFFILGLTGAFVLSLFLPFTGIVKTIFFPPEDSDYVYVDIEKQQGTPLAKTDLSLRAMEEILYDKSYVDSFTSTAGSASNFTGSMNSGSRYGNITVKLKADRNITSTEAAVDLRKSFSDIKDTDISVTEQQGGPPSGSPVLIRFSGDDLDELTRLANHAESILGTIPGAINIKSTTENVSTGFSLTIDRAKASALGVTPATVASTLRTAILGVTATTIKRQGEDIDVVVKLALDPNYTDPSETTNVSIDAVRNIKVRTQKGTVLLGSILKENIDSANTSIAHKDKERIQSVSADVAPGVTATEVTQEFQKHVSELDIPNGISISYGGETEDVNRSFLEMFLALIAGLVLMLAILVLSFNSVRYALYLLAAVPLSLTGVLDGLALTGQPISFTSLLGVVALAGVIINHAIILMDSMLRYRREEVKRPLNEVVADAAVSRFRPIILTTIATAIGMIPLSRISDFWSPLAYAIMFGLSFAMILTLALVPTLFYRHEKKLLEKAQKLS